MNKLMHKFGQLLEELANADEGDAYQLVAAMGVVQLSRIADSLAGANKVNATIAEALAMLAKSGDAQGKALEALSAELVRHREVVDDLIGEIQAMNDATTGQGGQG